MEETLEKLQNSSTKMEEAEKEFKDKEEDVNAQSRRVLLLEEEVSYSHQRIKVKNCCMLFGKVESGGPYTYTLST